MLSKDSQLDLNKLGKIHPNLGLQMRRSILSFTHEMIIYLANTIYEITSYI